MSRLETCIARVGVRPAQARRLRERAAALGAEGATAAVAEAIAEAQEQLEALRAELGEGAAVQVLRQPDEAPLEMPDPAEGIESLIKFAINERARDLAKLRKRAEKGGEMGEEAARWADEIKAVSPAELQEDMRAFPRHYIEAMLGRTGPKRTALAVYRDRVNRPPMLPRARVAPLAIGQEALAPDLMGTLRTLQTDLQKASRGAPVLTVDKGALPGAAGGAFDPRTGQLVQRRHNDLDTVAHEVGHWVGEAFGLKPEANDTDTRAELARFAVHGTAEKGERAMAEGMAEWLRAWMVNPEEASLRAPRFSATFERAVPRAVKAALRTYGDSVRRFEGAASWQKMAAGQRTHQQAMEEQKKAGRWYAPFAEWVKEWMGRGRGAVKTRRAVMPDRYEATVMDRVRFHLTDKEAFAVANYETSLVLVGWDGQTLRASEDYRMMRKVARGLEGRLREGVMRHGLPNADGTTARDEVTGQAMAMGGLLEPAVEAEESGGASFGAFLDRAHAYGSAQRTLEIADRLTVEIERDIEQFTKERMEEAAADAFRRRAAEKAAAEYAAEKREELRKQLAQLTAAGGGIRSATEVAEAALEEMENDPQKARIIEYLRRYRAWANWNLQRAVDGELLSRSEADRIRQANEFYMDWHRVFADDDGPVNIGEAVRGSSRTMHNPLASLLHATWGTVTRSERNRLMLAYTAPLRATPAHRDHEARALASLGRVVSQETAEEALKKHNGYVDDGAGGKSRIYAVQRIVAELDKDGDPLMDRDGRPVEESVTEWWAFDAATEASFEALRAERGDDVWQRLSQSIINLQRMAITSALPFRLKVPVRDSIERMMVSESKGLLATGGGVGKTFVDPVTGKVLETEREFYMSGASMAGWAQKTREQNLALVVGWQDDTRKQGWKWLSAGAWLRMWDRLGEKVENLARRDEWVAAFKKARRAGASMQDARIIAATAARGLLDTAESGRTVQQLNRWFLFLNAQIKGLERNTLIARKAAKALRHGDVATATKLGTLLAVRNAHLAAISVGLRLLALAMSDDDEAEELLTTPAWKRDFAWVLPFELPGLGRIAIPKPYEQGLLASGWERLADWLWASGKAQTATRSDERARWQAHADQAYEGYGTSVAINLTPMRFDDLAGGATTPLMEVMLNKSVFTGAPIISPYEEGMDLELRKGTERASPLGRGLSAVAAPVLGDRFGDPRALDHLLRGFLGGHGAMLTSRSPEELVRRGTGYGGTTSPWAERDTAWVLEWGERRGVGQTGPWRRLRDLVSAAAKGGEKERATAREVAQALRKAIEEGRIKGKDGE